MMAKGRDNHFYRNGLRAGYTEYRYGETRPVTLAGTKKTKPIVKGPARESLVNRLIEAMDDWRKTPFENEGAARAGVRIGFILQGHAWDRSDGQAAEIVAEALKAVGAQRPSWEEAQPGYALSSDFCSWCFSQIDEEDQSRGRRFCCASCAKAAVDHMARKSTRHYGAIVRSAIRLIDKENSEPQTCEYCERSFKSERKARFCSISCSTLFQAGDRVLHERQCEVCQTTFKPWRQGHRYCSRGCGQRAIRKAETESLAGIRLSCESCATTFQPTSKRSRFCSASCASRESGRAYNLRNRALPPAPAICGWCGDGYQPKIKLRGKVGYCSQKCASDKSRAERGTALRLLTRRTFDHYLVVPVDEFRRRRLTPDKLDWFLMEMGRSITSDAMMPRVTDHLFEMA